MPYTVAGTLGAYQAADWSRPRTQTVYDALGRTTVVTGTDGSAVRSFYQERQTAVIDPLNHQAIRENDALGTPGQQPAVLGHVQQPVLERDGLRDRDLRLHGPG